MPKLCTDVKIQLGTRTWLPLVNRELTTLWGSSFQITCSHSVDLEGHTAEGSLAMLQLKI